MKVIIIGAGPAGCALAHGLRTLSPTTIDVKIYEKAPSATRNRYWAFTLGWARPYLLSLLPPELAAQIDSCTVDPATDPAALGEDRIVLYNGATREEAYSFAIPRAREVNVRKLRALLEEGLGVEYGRVFAGYEVLDSGEGVRVWFEDGTSEEGDVVVGVDGAGSSVRRGLLGAGEIQEVLPFALVNFAARYSDERARWLKRELHPLVDIAIHPQRGHYIRANVLDMPDVEDASTWTFQILSTWPLRSAEDFDNGEEDRLERLKRHVERDGWAEPYRSAIEWIPEDTEVLKDQLKIWKTRPWDNRGGRVTLCGDAAHAMTFHRGQGANNAFFSAHSLVQALKSVQDGTKSLKDAITEYDESIWKRGAHEVQISKEQSFYTHDWENFINSPVMTLGTKPSHAAKSAGYE